ncbi:alpha-1A adrenergic receptor-like [Actinia tenebrosa]|uniref:Alpha-1A adrenergic receptor-like n=1 Tax=Actinia tenebrosa TaxID=6105 RepID=A0A6P8II90_ACTTE|nr:alpha-1A adrenergic receptor-like [Actinia tenebrosa]
MCIGWSFSTLVIICVDRYLYIEYPMYYTAVVTTKKLKVATAITWPVILVIILFGRVIFKDSDKTRVLLEVLIIALGVVIIVFCLTKVSLTAHRQTRTISIQQATFQQTNNSVLDRIKEAKRTFTLGSIVLASALLYCPFVIINIITGIKGQGDNADFKYISRSIALTCLHFQSLLNPFILSLRLSPIREGVTTKMRAHLAWLVP